MLPMDEKYINLVKEAEDLFDKIIKDSAFTQEKKGYERNPFIQESRKSINICLTNKT